MSLVPSIASLVRTGASLNVPVGRVSSPDGEIYLKYSLMVDFSSCKDKGKLTIKV